jgi:hypothetical protein
MPPKFVKPERVWLSNHPEYGEIWVQQRIAEDPSILGLGDLVLKVKELVGLIRLACHNMHPVLERNTPAKLNIIIRSFARSIDRSFDRQTS